MSYGQSTDTNEFSAAYPGSSNTNGFVSTGNSSDHPNIDSSDTTSRLDSSSASTTENWKPTALAGGRSSRQTEESSDASKPGMGDKLRGTAETLTGKVTGNTELVEQGQERKIRNAPIGDAWVAE